MTLENKSSSLNYERPGIKMCLEKKDPDTELSQALTQIRCGILVPQKTIEELQIKFSEKGDVNG